MTAEAAFFRPTDGGIVLDVRVTPGARRDEICGLQPLADGGHALKVSVTAAPDKGKANKAVIALLAKRFGFAKSALGLVSGATSRNKRIMITGAGDDIARALVAGLNELDIQKDKT